MATLNPLIELEALECEFKKLTGKMNVILGEHSNASSYESFPEEEKTKYIELLCKLSAIARINDYTKMDCSQHRGLRTYYFDKDKCENIRPNGRESMQIRLWNNMEKYSNDSNEMNDVVILKRDQK